MHKGVFVLKVDYEPLEQGPGERVQILNWRLSFTCTFFVI